MDLGLLHTLLTGLHFAALGGLYGLLIAIPWSLFLVAGRLRRLFESLPLTDWRVSYVLCMPLPAMVWAFVCGSVLTLSRGVRPPTRASELYVAGVDGIVAATVVSLPLWPLVLLYVLPSKGFDWYAEERGSTTVALVVGGTVWYLLWLVVPMYAFVFLAGLGDVMTGT